jgi:hypothetical protein
MKPGTDKVICYLQDYILNNFNTPPPYELKA